MPDQLSLRGASSLSILLRGLIKANLIHHLAHTGGKATLTRIGRAWKPAFDWLPPGGQAFDERLVPLYAGLCATPTPLLFPERFHVLEKAAAADPEALWTWVLLGLNYLRLWDGDAYFKRALECLERAVALRPDWSWGYLLRGEAKRSLLDYQGALEDYDEALAREPKLAWAHAFKARVLFQMRTNPRDIGLMDRAIKLSPREGWMRCWRGESLRRIGKLSQAGRDLREGLRQDPLYDQGYGWRAKLLEAQGKHDEAARSLAKGIALCPAFEKAYRQLFRVQKATGDARAALKTLDKAAALNHRNDWLGNWRVEGHADDEAGRAALAALEPLLNTNPRARAWRAETLLQLGRLDEALRELEGGDAWSKAWRGECLARLGKPADALRVLDDAVLADPSYGRAWAWRGRAHVLLGDWKAAVEDFDRALAARRVEYAWIFGWRGQAKLELGRLPEALADLDAAILLDGGCKSFYLWRAKARRAAGDERGCRDDLLRAADGAFPWRAVIDAQERRRDGAYAEAFASLSPAVERLGAGQRWLYLLRYRLRREAGLPGAARDLDTAYRGDEDPSWLYNLAPVPSSAPDGASLAQDALFVDAGVLAYAGQARLKRGDATGLELLRRAAYVEPRGWILAWLGEAERQAGRREAALAAFDRAVAVDARYDNAYAWRASVRLAQGDAAGAVSDLSRALALRPTARAHRDLARAYAALGDWKKALESQSAAARLNPELGFDADLSKAPDVPMVRAWRAEKLLRDGKAAEALRAAASAGRSSFALAFRAEARLALGDAQGAARDAAASRKLDARWARSREAEARAKLALGAPKEALARALEAARLAPYSARVKLLAAQAAAACGAKGRAKMLAEKSLALCPRYPEAEAFLRDLFAPAPADVKWLEFFVNYGCNAKCPFCFNPPDASPELEAGLPFKELARRMYAGYAQGYRGVKFIGGEVTIREDLPKLLALARKIGFGRVQLTTNGIRLADARYAARLVSLGVDTVRFSVHGHTPELHDRLVAVPGALRKIEAAARNLRAAGVASLGINYVLNRVNASALPETLLYFKNDLGIEDSIVYFLRYQGFGALPENKALLKLSMPEAAEHVRRAFAALKRDGARAYPALIHFTPCAMPELAEHMLDWKRDDADPDRVTLPDGSEGRIADVTNSGKKHVAACARCELRDVCLGVEENYVAEFGESEFQPISKTESVS